MSSHERPLILLIRLSERRECGREERESEGGNSSNGICHCFLLTCYTVVGLKVFPAPPQIPLMITSDAVSVERCVNEM
jgi:hypothetical protein